MTILFIKLWYWSWYKCQLTATKSPISSCYFLFIRSWFRGDSDAMKCKRGLKEWTLRNWKANQTCRDSVGVRGVSEITRPKSEIDSRIRRIVAAARVWTIPYSRLTERYDSLRICEVPILPLSIQASFIYDYTLCGDNDMIFFLQCLRSTFCTVLPINITYQNIIYWMYNNNSYHKNGLVLEMSGYKAQCFDEHKINPAKTSLDFTLYFGPQRTKGLKWLLHDWFA